MNIESMNATQFWKLTDVSAGLSWTEKKRSISAGLQGLSEGELLDYSILFHNEREKAFTPTILCGAFLLSRGAFGHDYFLDFTDCLVATSSETFYSILRDPENLADHSELAACPEMHFSQLAMDILESRGGDVSEMLYQIEQRATPHRGPIFYRGKKDLEIITPATVSELLPKLFGALGEEAFR